MADSPWVKARLHLANRLFLSVNFNNLFIPTNKLLLLHQKKKCSQMSAAARCHENKTKWPPNIIVNHLILYQMQCIYFFEEWNRITITISKFCQELFLSFLLLFCFVFLVFRFFFSTSEMLESLTSDPDSGTSDFF